MALLAGCHPSREDAMRQARQSEAEALRLAQPKQRLKYFGGELLGKDLGEFGGEVAFRESDGTTYRVVHDNSHGLLAMPYGAIAMTGLAHMSTNRGHIYLLSRPAGSRVTAQLIKDLPGAPCEVTKSGDRIRMRIFTGDDVPDLGCYELAPDMRLQRLACPATTFSVCFK